MASEFEVTEDGGRRVVVLLGDGKPLFAPGMSRQDLELARIKPYANGVAAASYTRKPAA
jgi:hypothetical protein